MKYWFIADTDMMLSFFFSSHTASAATLVNVRNARKHFERIEKLDSSQSQQLVQDPSLPAGGGLPHLQ